MKEQQPPAWLVKAMQVGFVILFVFFLWGVFKFTMWQMEPSVPPPPEPTQLEKDRHALHNAAKKVQDDTKR